MNANRTSTSNKRGETGQTRLATLGALAAMVIAVLFGAGITRDAQADPASPLLVTKTANPSPVASGAQLTYTITMTNTGGSKLSSLVMTDQVNGVGVIQNPPALPQLQITSTQGTCSQGGPNGNVVTCNGGILAGGATWTVTIRGQVTASNGTTLNNTASVTGTRSAQTFSTSATSQTLVQGGTGGGSPQADLTINKTGPSSVAVSSPMTYTLTVNNVGTAHATNVRVVDTVPPGVAIISAAGTSLFVCGIDSQTVTCDGGAVNFGQNATITINGTSPALAGTITNTAVVDPDNNIAESNELNNTSATVYTSVGLPPSGPLLDIKKTDSCPGTPPLPPAPPSWCTGAGPDPVTPGQQITYKIQVTNNANGNNSRADDVIVTDGTQGLEASSIVVSQVIVNGTVGTFGGCVVTAPQVRCSIRSLNKGGTMTLTITGTVISSAGATIFNTATVTGNVKNTGVTNTASEATTVKPAVDLTITKADSPDPVCARSWPIDGIVFPPGPATSQHLPLSAGVPAATGSPTELLAPPVCLGGLTYNFVVGNSGILEATDVVVRDPLPSGLIFDTYDSDAGFTCAVNPSNVVTCSGGTIPAESIRNLSFLLVAPPALGTITNTVYVDPNNAIFEPDETNNTFVQTTNVVTGVDLVVWKSDSNFDNPPGDDTFGAPTLIEGDETDLADGYDPIATSGTQTVTIYVDNVGTQDTTGIRLWDTLPAGTRFLSVMEVPGGPGGTLHGFTCTHNGAATGGIVECAGGHLRGTESEFYEEAGAPLPTPPGDHFATIKIQFFARPQVGSMHNEVRVDPLDEIVEVNEQNNLATDETVVTVGDADKGAYHQLAVEKTHVSPEAGTVATNGTLIYNLRVSNLGTDPVSNIILLDTLPAGTRFIEAKDTATGSSAFFCSHDGSAYGGVITCIGGDLDGSINQIPVGDIDLLLFGHGRDVTVKVFAPNTPGTYNNLGTVDPNNLVPEGNEFDNDDQLSTLVAPCVGAANCTIMNAFYELTIAKTQNSPDPGPVATNGVITYDLLITNLGSDPVYGITVKDTLPAGSRFIDAKDTAPADPDAFSCGAPDGTNTLTCTGGVLDGTLGTLVGPPDAPEFRTIRIRIFAPNTPGSYPNQGIVDPADTIPEGNQFNNVSTVNTAVAPCVGLVPCTDANAFYELTIAKEQNRPTIARNGLETYTLTIENLGSDPVSDIVVQDSLPVGSRLLDAKDTAPPSDPAAFTCGGLDATGMITCTGGDLSGTVVGLAGIPTSRTIIVRAFMPDTPSNLSTDDGYPNQSVVDPFNAIPEGNEFNNESSLVTVVLNDGPDPYIDLALNKVGPSTAQPGERMFYDLTITNAGEGDAFNVTVTDSLNPLTTLVSTFDTLATPGQFICSNVAALVTCTGGTIPAGGFRIIRVVADAPASIEEFADDPADVTLTIRNEAFVDPYNTTPEGDETNNGDGTSTVVKAFLNLTISKEGPTSATQNDTTEYVIKATNNIESGPGALAEDVVVVDNLPVGLIPLGWTAGGDFQCEIFGNPVNSVRCIGDLEAGATVEIHLSVFVTADGGTLDNEACIDPDKEIAETNEIDNCHTAVTGVTDLKPDLQLNKSASSGVVQVGETFTYTVSVSNSGNATATGPIVMTDTLPSEVTLVANGIQAPAGWTCVNTPPIECTNPNDMAQGENAQFTIEVTVNAGAQGTFVNTASVTVAAGETNPTNNIKSLTTSVGGSGIDLTIVSIVDSPDPINRPGELTYTVVAANNGSAAANGVVVRIDLPDIGTSGQVGAGTNGFNCDPPSGGNIDCTGDLPVGGNTIITVTLTVDAGAPNDLKLLATIDPANAFGESDETNNSLDQTTTVTGDVCVVSPCVDLVVADVFDNPDPVTAGGTVNYVVSIVNVGDSPVSPTAIWEIHFFFTGTYTTVTLTPPAGVGCAVVGGDPHHIHCTSTAGADGMDLGPGDGLLFNVEVTGIAAGSPTLNVQADFPSFAIAEFSEGNNSVTETTTVNP